jgi:hypothetical protein
MTELLDNPAVQGGVAPLVVALVVAFALARTRFAWIAIGAGYATMVALSVGFSFSPLTIARKTVLVGLLVPLVGIGADLLPRPARAIAPALAVAAGVVSAWVVLAILVRREAAGALAMGGGIALFVALLVGATLRLREDGLRCGAAGLGLGLATGIAGVLSASIGHLVAGAAVAAAAGAMLLVQIMLSRNLAPHFLGALPLGMLPALSAAGTLLLAELPWYALPLLLLVPIAASLPAPERAPAVVRAAALAAYALAAAALPILAAWHAARGSST